MSHSHKGFYVCFEGATELIDLVRWTTFISFKQYYSSWYHSWCRSDTFRILKQMP